MENLFFFFEDSQTYLCLFKIEERKMEEMRRKEQERMEEEKEQRRVEEQQRRMQAEYEEERRKIKEKEEEVRKLGEEHPPEVQWPGWQRYAQASAGEEITAAFAETLKSKCSCSGCNKLNNRIEKYREGWWFIRACMHEYTHAHACMHT